MTVTLLDTENGKTKQIEGYDVHWWCKGHGSCDCDRSGFMGVDIDIPYYKCIGAKRFLIVESDDETHDLYDLNQNYPKPLVTEHCCVRKKE